MGATSHEHVDFPLPARETAGGEPNQKDWSSIFDRLLQLDEDDFVSSVLSSESRVSRRRYLASAMAGEKILPTIVWTERTIILPSTFREKSDNVIGHYMLKAAWKLCLKVRLTPYDGAYSDTSEWHDSVALGVFMSLDDVDSNFNIKQKTDGYEVGRTVARAQQLLGLTSAMGHTNEILKPSHYYFANNPGETKKVDKNMIKVGTAKTEFLSLIRESDWRPQLVDILFRLMREVYTLIPYDTLINDLKPNIVTYGHVVNKFCAMERVVEPAKGKRKAVTSKKVPGKPKQSPLLLKQEMDLLTKISAPLFGKTSLEVLTHDEWVHYILDNGLDWARKYLREIYVNRQTYLVRFAKLTTSRLQQLRKLSAALQTKKKSSVVQEDLRTLLLSKENPTATFVTEIAKLDPTGGLFLSQFYSGDTINYASPGAATEDDIKRLITKSVIDNNVYVDLRNDSQASHAEWVARALTAERALATTMAEYNTIRSKFEQTEKVRRLRKHENTLFDLLIGKGKVSLTDPIGNVRKRVPHEQKKSKGDNDPVAKPPDKEDPFALPYSRKPLRIEAVQPPLEESSLDKGMREWKEAVDARTVSEQQALESKTADEILLDYAEGKSQTKDTKGMKVPFKSYKR